MLIVEISIADGFVRGQNFDVNRKALSLYPFVASFKEMSLKSDFILFFFSWFYTWHVYSPKAGADNPLGTKFLCQQEHLVTLAICCKFQENSLKSDFIHFIHDFIHVYSPGAEADSPQGTKFWCPQKCLVTSFICCKFKKEMSLKSDFIHFFFHDLIHV